MQERALNIGLLQMDIYWKDPDKNIAVIKRNLDSTKEKIDLLVLPEMFLTGYILKPQTTSTIILKLNEKIKQLQEIAAQYQTAIIGSTSYTENNNFYNRCVLIEENKLSYYDKIHLYSPVGENLEYMAGNKVVNFDLKGIQIRPLICYDLRFPYLSMTEGSYDLLIYMANWPIPRIGHWNTLLKARAIENQSYTIGVNRIGGDENKISYNGASAAYQYDGHEMINLLDSETLQTVTLNISEQDNYRIKLPFSKDRKWL
jgi:omega-amidase